MTRKDGLAKHIKSLFSQQCFCYSFKLTFWGGGFSFTSPTLLSLSVIPAEAGIQKGVGVDSRLRGNDRGEWPGQADQENGWVGCPMSGNLPR